MLVWLFLCSRFSFRFAPVGVRPPVGEAYDIAGKARAQVVNVGLGVASPRIFFQISRPARWRASNPLSVGKLSYIMLTFPARTAPTRHNPRHNCPASRHSLYHIMRGRHPVGIWSSSGRPHLIGAAPPAPARSARGEASPCSPPASPASARLPASVRSSAGHAISPAPNVSTSARRRRKALIW